MKKIIQHDNAPPHWSFTAATSGVIENNLFNEKCTELGLQVSASPQAPNSPDHNVLDLAFFHSIQSLLQQQIKANKMDELLQAVMLAFSNLNTYVCERVWWLLSYQQCCINETIMIMNGGNTYKIPHINKSTLEKKGCFQITFQHVWKAIGIFMNKCKVLTAQQMNMLKHSC